MGISLSTALEENKANSNDNTIYELHLLERNVLRKLEEQTSKLYLTALNDECLPIVCAVDKKQAIVLKIDAVSENQVRHSLNELLGGNYLEEQGKIVHVRCIREQEHIALRFFCLLSFFPPKRKPQGLQQHPGVFHTSRITGHPESSATGFKLRIDESNGRR